MSAGVNRCRGTSRGALVRVTAVIRAASEPGAASPEVAVSSTGNPVMSSAPAPEASIAVPVRRRNRPVVTSATACVRVRTPERPVNSIPVQLTAPMTVTSRNAVSCSPAAQAATASTTRTALSTPMSRA
ncbi:hypothetical protein [Corynebacterium provencense]|uniref:hypothetical protein n=1 Tax=Corynebacterium provencense TaxID=1737425 RepID=UPI00098FFA4E|nr:hypothetical protein [Corynebacterium provencense]